MAKIEYIDKINDAPPPEGQVTASDMNEIKDVVNANADELNPTDTITVVNSIDNLRAKTDLVIGQSIQALNYYESESLGGGGVFECISENVGFSVQCDITESTSIDGEFDPQVPCNETDECWVRFKVDVPITVDAAAVFKFAGGSVANSISCTFRASSTPNDLYEIAYLRGTGEGVFDDDGIQIPSTELKYGIWYTSYSRPADGLFFNMRHIEVGAGSNILVSGFKVIDETFNLLEGTGDSTTGDNGTVLPIINTTGSTWVSNNYDNGFDKIQTVDKRLFERLIKNNTVSYYDAGCISNDNIDIYENDCLAAMQLVNDSPYRINNGGGNFYLTGELFFRVAKDVILSGEYIYGDVRQAEDRENDYLHNKSTTVFYSNLNINFLTVESVGIPISNGLVYTRSIPNHTGHAWRLELTGEIWSGEFNNINVLGRREELLNEGIGTKGFVISNNGSASGYATSIKVTGNFKYCSEGVTTDLLDDVGGNSWANSFVFDIHMKGCKKFYNISSLDFCDINGMLQDSPVLGEAEKEFYAVTVLSNNAHINVFTYDRTNTGDPVGSYRHSINYMYAPGDNVKLGYLTQRDVSVIDVVNAEKKLTVKDPMGLAISNSNEMIIADVNSQVRFNGDLVDVKFRGFAVVDPLWYDANLYPADDVLNTDPLNSTPNFYDAQCEVSTPFGFLTRRGESREQRYNIKAEEGFAEIEIPFINSESIQRVAIGLTDSTGIAGVSVRKIQLITYNATDRYTETLESGNLNRRIYDLFNTSNGTISNTTFDGIIIRLIGSTNLTQWMRVNTVAVTTQYQTNKPLIHIGGGQDINGDLSFPNSDTGMILKDRTLNTEYRLVVDNGVLGVESI